MAERLANTAAERDILGGILTAPADLHKTSGIIRAGDFYRQDYRAIYETMAGMILQGDSLDIVTLCEELRKTGLLEKVGGVRNISDLASVGRCWNIQEKAEIVADYARRRRLIEKAHELETLAADAGQNVDSITASFCEDLAGISRRADNSTGDMRQAVMEFMATLERRKQGDTLATGLQDVDRIITGFEPGQLITIAGRPGHGKSALAGTIAVNLAKKGKRILLFSLEMRKSAVAGRFASRLANIPGGLLKKPGEMTAEQKAALSKGLEAVEGLPITINDRGDLTPGEVASTAARMKRTAGLDLVIVDYLQLMSSGRKQDTNKVQEVSFITRGLKGLADSLSVPIVILSQLNRANERAKEKPKLVDLRDSGSIEQDSDTVLLLHRAMEPGGGLSNKTSVNVAKQRDGEIKECDIYFITSRGYFVNYDSSWNVPL